MIGIAAAAVLGLAIVALVWVRIAARQSERRSVRDYERALGALGGASRRSDRPARAGQGGQGSVGPPMRIAPGQPHVRAASEGELPPPRPAADRLPPKARIELGSRQPPRHRPEQGRPAARRPGEVAAGPAPARPGEVAAGPAPARPGEEPTVPGRPVPAPRPAARPGRGEPGRYSAPQRRVYGPPLPGERESASAGAPAGVNGAGGDPPAANGDPAAVNGAAGDPAPRRVTLGEPLPVRGAPGDPAPVDIAGRGAARSPLDPGDPPTEAVEVVDRSLPPVALDQLVARSRRLRRGSSARAALAGGAALRTTVPGTELAPAVPAVVPSAQPGEAVAAPPPDELDEAAAAGSAPATDAAIGAAGDEVPIVFDFDELAEPPVRPSQIRPLRGLQRPGERRGVRRLLTAATAAVTAAAAGVGIWQLATRTSPVRNASSATRTSTPPSTRSSSPPTRSKGPTKPAGGHRGGTKAGTPPPTTSPSTLTPVSSSANVVVYRAPGASYTLRFTVSAGACWVGAHNGSVWIWQATVVPGTPATYAATGTATIRIGAPSVISVTADGKPVVLPKTAQPYDLEFTAAAT